MTIHNETPSVTVVSGAWSGNTVNVLSGKMGMIFIEPATANTQYDFSLTDNGNRKVYEKKAWVGVLRDYTPFLIKGIYTMAIANADVDETFKVLLSMEE